MPNVHDDDIETLWFADESDYLNEDEDETPDAAAAYDTALLNKARSMSKLDSTEDMRAWLASQDWSAGYADRSYEVVQAAVFGQLKAVTAELVRWLERIPEAHRG